MVQSPQLSPMMATSSMRTERRSVSPPIQPMSKRDKHRNKTMEKLRELEHNFSANKDHHYRTQLQALQVDGNLIIRADPFSKHPLEDRDGDLLEIVRQAGSVYPRGLANLNENNTSQIAGKVYSEFVTAVNDAMAERDKELTVQHNFFSRSATKVETDRRFMKKLAEEEHKLLSTSLKDRLVNSVNGRKNRILKEKDDLFNIAESNAIHLHPNQFSIASANSPAPQLVTKRATRQRRELEDTGFVDNKRKRKGVDDNGSPGPSKRVQENGFSTPIWSTEQVARSLNKSNGSAAYSVEKLFTEKELQMAYYTASQSAYKKTNAPRKSQNDSNTPQNGIEDFVPQNGDSLADMDLIDDAPDSPPGGSGMVRTRSTRNNATALANSFQSHHGIEGLTHLDQAPNFETFAAQLPKLPSTNASKSHGRDDNGSVFKAGESELFNDMSRIKACVAVNRVNKDQFTSLLGANGDLGLLKAATDLTGDGERYEAWVTNSNERIPPRVHVDALGGIPMSKQASSIEMGGVPMSRQDTGDGSSMGRRRRP